jgi:hypothetical protein
MYHGAPMALLCGLKGTILSVKEPRWENAPGQRAIGKMTTGADAAI